MVTLNGFSSHIFVISTDAHTSVYNSVHKLIHESKK